MRKYGLPEENVYGHKKRLEFLISEIKSFSNDSKKRKLRILDVGCGTGEMITLPIAEEGYDVTGMDMDESSIKRAKTINRLKNVALRCETLHGLASKSRKKYDVIICSEVLEHLKNPREGLLAMKSMLKTDGLILVTIPNGYGPFEWEVFIFLKLGIWKIMKLIDHLLLSSTLAKRSSGKNPIRMTNNPDSKHIQFFSLEKFSKLLKSCELLMDKKHKSCVFAGPVSNFIFSRSPYLIDWNVNRAVKYLPFSLCSGWYFVIKVQK